MYTFESRVRYSEISHRGTMSLPSLINYFQDCSTFHSEEAGLGMKQLKERKKAWILSYWQVVVERFPELGETIRTGTFASGFKGLYGYRNFVMEDGEGRRIAYAHSVWVFMDLEKGRPCRPDDSDILPYGTEPPLQMAYEERKIRIPDTWENCPGFPVRKYHIDTNEHVNNCQYVQMAMEVLPDDLEIHQLRVEYKKSAVLGDKICPQIFRDGTRSLVQLCDEAGKPYAVIEIR